MRCLKQLKKEKFVEKYVDQYVERFITRQVLFLDETQTCFLVKYFLFYQGGVNVVKHGCVLLTNERSNMTAIQTFQVYKIQTQKCV